MKTYRGVLIRLATVDDDQLRELLIEAWRMVAPKGLIHELDEEVISQDPIRSPSVMPLGPFGRP